MLKRERGDRVKRVEGVLRGRVAAHSLCTYWYRHCSVRCSHLQCLKKASLSSYTKNKEPAWKDVTLYDYNRQKFFRLVGLACASQFIFWGWMAYFLISLERRRSQEKVLGVSSSSSNPGASWKIVRFVMVSINQTDIQSYTWHLLCHLSVLKRELRSESILDGQVGRGCWGIVCVQTE